VKKMMDGPMKGDITHIGGITDIGESWNLSINKAIHGIQAGIWEFYLMERLEEIPVKVCVLDAAEPFLAAKGQGYLHNLLEDLPECTFAFEF